MPKVDSQPFVENLLPEELTQLYLNWGFWIFLQMLPSYITAWLNLQTFLLEAYVLSKNPLFKKEILPVEEGYFNEDILERVYNKHMAYTENNSLRDVSTPAPSKKASRKDIQKASVVKEAKEKAKGDTDNGDITKTSMGREFPPNPNVIKGSEEGIEEGEAERDSAEMKADASEVASNRFSSFIGDGEQSTIKEEEGEGALVIKEENSITRTPKVFPESSVLKGVKVPNTEKAIRTALTRAIMKANGMTSGGSLNKKLKGVLAEELKAIGLEP